MEDKELREEIDGFLTDLESDIKKYGLTESIRESAVAVFAQIIREFVERAGYVKMPPDSAILGGISNLRNIQSED